MEQQVRDRGRTKLRDPMGHICDPLIVCLYKSARGGGGGGLAFGVWQFSPS